MFYLFHLYLDNGGAPVRIIRTADHAQDHFKQEA